MKKIYFILGVVLLLFPTSVYAYIDPTTTAIVAQIVIGVLITLGIFVRIFWRRIVIFFQKIRIKIFKK